MARNDINPYRGGGLPGGSDSFQSIQREMNRLFDDVFRGFGMPLSRRLQGEGAGVLQPDVDVSETDKEIRVCADLPGVSDSDVHVELNEDVLNIRADRRQERKEDREDFHVTERSYGTFQRSLRLPSSIDADKVEASFENGVLTVIIPKTEESQRSRRIAVLGRGGPRAGTAQADAGSIGAERDAGAAAGGPEERRDDRPQEA